jgi:hypothetical protein
MRTRTVVALLAVSALTSSGWVYALDSAPKLKADDLVEIQQLYAKYSLTIDAGDAEGYASTFTPDGVFGTNVGHDALVKFTETFHAGVGSHVRHWNSNLLIQPTPTGASGQVSLILVDFATTPASIMRVGSYTDELVKTAQGWRFRKRATSFPTAPAAPTKPGS